MSCVLTLVAGPGKVLADRILDRVRGWAAAGDLDPRGPVWLSARRACDVALSGPGDVAGLEADLAAAGVDFALQPVVGRRKRLLVADMDSTIITTESLDELADLCGLAERIVPITRAAMNGELDFEQALRARVTLLAGRDASLLDRVWAQTQFTPGAKALVATMAAHGAETVLISGGFTQFTDRVRSALGFTAAHGNRLEISGGRLTGAVVGPLVDRQTKAQILADRRAALGLGPGDTLAVGDGANDLPMLAAAGLGIAYRGKPAVRAQAPVRIDHGDLTTALYFQGFTDREIQT